MRYRFSALSLLSVVLLAACSSEPVAPSLDLASVRFWRPISEPNVLLKSDVLQKKLDFDLSQCKCSIFPKNAARDESLKFRADEQRLAQTDVTAIPDAEGNCHQSPSLVVAECMRHRGWEPTSCSGRLSLPSGGSVCAGYAPIKK